MHKNLTLVPGGGLNTALSAARRPFGVLPMAVKGDGKGTHGTSRSPGRAKRRSWAETTRIGTSRLETVWTHQPNRSLNINAVPLSVNS